VRRLVRRHRSTIDGHGGDDSCALRSVDLLEPRWSGESFERLMKIVGCGP
jgi:hypothetical protein